MMNRRVVRVLLVALLAGLGIAVPASRGMAQQADQGVADSALSTLADCVATSDRVLALFLIDESGSLRNTDPDNRRVDALRAALSGLEQVRESSEDRGVAIRFDIRLAGFSAGFDPLTDWTPLDEASASDLDARSAAFADRNRGIDTDYTAGLIGAQEAFAAQAATGGGSSTETCKALFWFTDGEFDIEPRSTGESKSYAPDIALNGPDDAVALESRGRSLLCDQGGVVDQLRRDQISVVAFGLAASIEPSDESFLRAMAQGTSESGESCGQVPIPDGWVSGAYVSAAEVTDLIGRFYGVVIEILEGTRVEGGDLPVCPREECPQGTQTFVVDPGIRSFNVLALTGSAGIDVELRSPETDAPLVVAAGESGAGQLGSTNVAYTWIADDGLVLEADLPDEAGVWSGEWSVTFVDRTGENPGAVAQAQIFIFGGLLPVLEPTTFRAGESNPFTVTIEHEEGMPADSRVFGAVELRARVFDPTSAVSEAVELRAEGDGRFVGEWAGPTTDFPSAVNVSVQLDAVTASGLALRPITRTFSVPVNPPSSYPSVSPTDLRLSSITGAEPATGTLTVTGGDSAGGCLWIENVTFDDVPEQAGDMAVRTVPAATSSEDCLVVGSGEVREIQFEAEPETAANGSARGELTIRLTSEANPDALTVTVPVSFDMARPVNEAERLVLFIVLMLVGLLLPLALLMLLNWLTGKFEAPSGYREAAVPVLVTASGSVLRRNEAGVASSSFSFEHDDFTNVGGSGGRRRSFSTPAGLSFRSRSIRLDLGPPEGVVTADGRLLASGTGGGTAKDGRSAPVPLALAGTWILVVDEPIDVSATQGSPSGTESADVVGRLVAYARVGSVGEQSTSLNADIRYGVPAAADALRGVAERTSPPVPAAQEADAPEASAPSSSLGGDAPSAAPSGPPTSSFGRSPDASVPPSPDRRPPERRPAGDEPGGRRARRGTEPPEPPPPPPDADGPPPSTFDDEPPGSSW